MKLLVDEMYPRRIAEELRARGYDAVSVHDAPGAGTTDEAVFDHARSEHRAVVTEKPVGGQATIADGEPFTPPWAL